MADENSTVDSSMSSYITRQQNPSYWMARNPANYLPQRVNCCMVFAELAHY